MRKFSTMILLLLALSKAAMAQPARNDIRPDFVRALIQKLIDSAKKAAPRHAKELDYPLEAGREFKLSVWDKGSSFVQQGFSMSDIDLSSQDLLSANLIFSDKDQVQKIIFSPFKLSDNENIRRRLSSFKVNMALKGGISTFGLGIGGDSSNPFGRRAVKLFQQKNRELGTPKAPKDGEKFEDFEKRVLVPFRDKLDSLLISYNEQRTKHVFKWSTGYNLQLFAVLEGNGNVLGFDTLNAHATKAHNFSVSTTYSYDNGKLVLGLAMNYAHARKSAALSQKKIDYWSPSVNLSFRAFELLDDLQLQRNEQYKKTLFRPGIHFGFTYDYTQAKGDYRYYADAVRSAKTIAPFADLILTESSQFRISMPVTRTSYVDVPSQTILGANLQYNFKLTNLK